MSGFIGLFIIFLYPITCCVVARYSKSKGYTYNGAFFLSFIFGIIIPAIIISFLPNRNK